MRMQTGVALDPISRYCHRSEFTQHNGAPPSEKRMSMKHTIFAVLGVILLVLTISKVNAEQGKATAMADLEKLTSGAK